MRKMKKEPSLGWKSMALLLLWGAAQWRPAPALSAQSGAGLPILVSAARTGSPATAGEIVREIDDPHTGARWLLMRNTEHPGGPGILELVEEGRGSLFEGQIGAGTIPKEFRPMIRAGERLVVEENSAVAVARLEAVALASAVIGSNFEARLTIGGMVVRAQAIAPGRAELLPQREAWR